MPIIFLSTFIYLFIFLSAKPIDLLARYVSSEEEDFTVEMHEPYVYLNVSSCYKKYILLKILRFSLKVCMWFV